MSGDLQLWISSALAVLGASVMMAGNFGLVWLPDVYTKAHAASKSVFLGSFPVLIALLLLVTNTTISHDVTNRCCLSSDGML